MFCDIRRPIGAFGVPQQYERSFRWKLAQFYNLCRVSLYILVVINNDGDDNNNSNNCRIYIMSESLRTRLLMRLICVYNKTFSRSVILILCFMKSAGYTLYTVY